MKIRPLFSVFLGTLLLTSSVCVQKTDQAKSRSSSISILYPFDETVIAPHWNMGARFLVFLPLVAFDKEGELKPRLAERWEHTPDYRKWTFHLRKNVKWHDGLPVTSHDIQFSEALWAQPAVEGFYKPEAVLTVIDNHTFSLTYEKPTDALDENFWKVFFPKHLLDGLDPKKIWKWDFWKHPVGNGPYRYVRHTPNTMVELEANPAFYRDKPKINKVVLRFGGGAPLLELMSGNVDVLPYANSIDILKIKKDPRFRVFYYVMPTIPWVEAIYWNHRSPFFRSPNVRKALTLAINRSELLKILNLPEDIPLFDVIFTGWQYRHGEIPEPISYDPELAQVLLEEEGWHVKEGDSIRQKEEDKFSFEALVPTGGASEGPRLNSAAIFIQDQLRHVGIDMEILTLESNVILQRLTSDDYDAVFFRFFNAPFQRFPWLGKNSLLGYNNIELSRIIKDAAQAVDPDKINRIYSAIQRIMQNDIPLTFLYPQVQTVIAHRRIGGLNSPFWADPVMNIDFLWIEEEE